MFQIPDASFVANLTVVAGIVLAGVLTPGPDFLISAHFGATSPRKFALSAVLGICFGSMAWASLSLAGLGVLFATMPWAYVLAKLLGATYLLFLGGKMLVSAWVGTDDSDALPLRRSAQNAFLIGFMTDLSNPKTAIFFASLFATVVPPLSPIWQQVVIVCTVGLIAFLWYGFVATVMANRRLAALYQRSNRLITGITGGIFVLWGTKLLLSR